MPLVGFLSTRSPDEAAIHTDAFRRGLEGMGYVEGRSITIEYRWAKGDYSRLPSFAADLLGRPLALIVAAGDPAALAVKATGKPIPMVFLVGQDPVRAGLVTSMNRPGKATGVNFFTGDLGGKRLELLCAMVPSAQTVGLLLNPRFGAEAAEQHRQAVTAAAQTLGRKLVVKEAATDTEIDAASCRTGGGRRHRPDRPKRSILRQPARQDPGAFGPLPAARHFPYPGISGRWRAHELWREPLRYLPSTWRLCRQDIARRQAGRPSGPAADQVRTGHQHQDRKDTWP